MEQDDSQPDQRHGIRPEVTSFYDATTTRAPKLVLQDLGRSHDGMHQCDDATPQTAVVVAFMEDS